MMQIFDCDVDDPIIWITWVLPQLLTLDQSDGTTGDEKFYDHCKNLDKFPVHAQHVTEIVFRLDPMKINDLGSYGFPDTVECQTVVPLAQSVMRKGTTGNNSTVIAEHIGL